MNHVSGMQKCQGLTVDTFGKDTTGKVLYTFNKQGFRSQIDYVTSPSVAFFGCSLVGSGYHVVGIYMRWF